jgi:hypothetical protein
MSEIAVSLEVSIYDLRDALSSSEQCLYQPNNMHWLPEGHSVVSDYLAELLAEAGYIP